MLVRRTNGSFPLGQLRSEMDRLVDDFFGPTGWGRHLPSLAPGFPALNVWEDGDTLYAEAEVPGMKGDDIDISVVGSDLTIRGRRTSEQQEGVAYHRQERGTGEFNRVLRLPVEVDANRVEAKLSDGVLLISMPKAESAKPKKIKVQGPQQ